MKKKVVVIGGGNGAAVSILALKRNLDLFAISAIISMSDSGGSSGKLRETYGSLPPGDILRALLAMSKYDYYTLRQIFYEVRFTETGKLSGHNLGNLFMVLAAQLSDKNFLDSVTAMHQALQCVGSVFPVTTDLTTLCAEYENGAVVKSEVAIDRPEHSRTTTIKRVWLEPLAPAHAPAVQALLEADYIILGPGSLYTSIIPSLLVPEIAQALTKSQGKIIYVLGNGFEAQGELGPVSMSGFITALQKYVPRPIDMILYNTAELGVKERRFYAEKNWAVVDRDVANFSADWPMVGHAFERDGGGLSKESLAEAFKKYCL